MWWGVTSGRQRSPSTGDATGMTYGVKWPGKDSAGNDADADDADDDVADDDSSDADDELSSPLFKSPSNSGFNRLRSAYPFKWIIT